MPDRTRRALSVALTLVLGSAAVAIAKSPPPQGSPAPGGTPDWPLLRGDASRGAFGSEGPRGDPVLRWRYQAQGPANAVVVAVGDLAYTTTDDGVVHALALSDGAERWSWTPDHVPPSAPSVDAGTVYVFDGLGFLVALDALTGTERWHSAGSLGAPSSPTVGMGMLFVAADDGAVHALALQDGAERWASQPPDAAGLHNPAYADGVVYVAGDAGGYNAIDARDGTLLWHYDLGGEPSGTAVVVGGIAYVGAAAAGGGHLQALDARSGALLWSDPTQVFSPGVAEGIAVSPGDAGVVIAHDSVTGTERWRTPVAGPTRPLAIASGAAFVGADDQHEVLALDLHTGERLWSFPVDGNIDCCTSVAHGVVLVGTGAGSIYAIGGDRQSP